MAQGGNVVAEHTEKTLPQISARSPIWNTSLRYCYVSRHKHAGDLGLDLVGEQSGLGDGDVFADF